LHPLNPLISSQRLVRFLAKDGRTYYGDAILPKGTTDISLAKSAKIIAGPIFGKHNVTEQVADIKQLLAPLALEDVKTVRCLGLNYEQHAKEVFILHSKPRKKINEMICRATCPSQNSPSSSYVPTQPLHNSFDLTYVTIVQTHHFPLRSHRPNTHPPARPTRHRSRLRMRTRRHHRKPLLRRPRITSPIPRPRLQHRKRRLAPRLAVKTRRGPMVSRKRVRRMGAIRTWYCELRLD
jgi:hypothetical protein